MKRRLKAAMAARELEERRAKPHAEKVLRQLNEWAGGSDVEVDLAGIPILRTDVPEELFPCQFLEPTQALVAFNLGVALDSIIRQPETRGYHPRTRRCLSPQERIA